MPIARIYSPILDEISRLEKAKAANSVIALESHIPNAPALLTSEARIKNAKIE